MSDKYIHVRVTPKASANKIIINTLLDGSLEYKVYVTCAPEGGNANKEIIALLAKELRKPKSSLRIKQGQKSRDKLIEVIN